MYSLTTAIIGSDVAVFTLPGIGGTVIGLNE